MNHFMLQYLNDSLGVQTRQVCVNAHFRRNLSFHHGFGEVGSPPTNRMVQKSKVFGKS
jgi:hypothetical protein